MPVTNRIRSQHHSATQPRKKGRFVKPRSNGSNGSNGAGYGMNRLLRPQARYNWLMPNVGAITPAYIEMVLNGAIAGSHVQQYELFDLMLRTWPELGAIWSELRDGVMRKKLIFEPYCEEDEQPTPGALERQQLVACALLRMNPAVEEDGNDLNGTLTNILDAWIRGVSVSEIVWNVVDDPKVGTITAPRTTFWVQPTQYGFAWDNSIGLRPRSERSGATGTGTYPFSTTSSQPVIVDPFPPGRFLVAIHKAKTGSPLGGPLLVPLAWWWCAANFSSDWLLNLAQVFGLPFRWGHYPTGASSATIDSICTMLQNMGSAGWAAFPEGVTMEMVETGKHGSDHSPQGELLDRADRYARNLILGQTMTGTHGTMGKGGGQAFGKVEAEVKGDRIDAAGRFAESVINKQLIPFILQANYGDTEDAPVIKFLEDEVADLTEAQRDTTLASGGLIIGMDYLRKKYDIPAPAEGEETIGGPKPMPDPFGGGGFGQDTPFEEPAQTNEPAKAGNVEMRSPNELSISVVDNHIIRGYMARIESGEELEPITLRANGRIKDGNHRAAAYKKLGLQIPTVIEAEDAGHPFRGNQYVIVIGDTVNTKYGKAKVVSVGENGAWVKFNEGRSHAWVPFNELKKIKELRIGQVVNTPHGVSKIRSVSDEGAWVTFNEGKSTAWVKHEAIHSGEAAEELQTKLEELNEIQDDALYTSELRKLVGLPVTIEEPEPKPEPAPPPPLPQVINVNVEAASVTPTHKSFEIHRTDGTVVEGAITET